MVGTTSIRWNNLLVDVPDQWEVIVKSARHLIFEKNLKPVAEIRWQPPPKKSSQNRAETIVRQLEPSGHHTRHSDPAELFPARLMSNFSTETYSLGSDSEEMVVLLTCRQCQTALLVRIYSSLASGQNEFAAVMASLNCHPGPEERKRWQILDFYFSLPDGFELERSSFRFGLTALTFQSVGTELRLCRLAPASHHLQQSSLAALFHSFSAAPPELQTAVDQYTLSYYHVPGAAGHLWSQIRRKKVYQASRFVHFPHHDRILGYSIRSSKPIEAWVEQTIKDGYGIVQEKEAAAGLDP